MTLRCDWCGDEMGREDEKGRYGHSLEFKAIDGLGLLRRSEILARRAHQRRGS